MPNRATDGALFYVCLKSVCGVVSTLTNTNIFRLTKKGGIHMNKFCLNKKGEYQNKYIWVDKKRANTNTNTNIWTGIHKYKYKYKYLSHTAPVMCHVSCVTCHLRKQPQPQTLSLVTSPICTVGWFTDPFFFIFFITTKNCRDPK